jgi:DNA-directed RNA polymerase subunit A"
MIKIIKNDNPEQGQIGVIIDKLLEKHKENIIQYGEENSNMELLDIEKLGYDIKIYTCNAKGKISFEKMTKVTRHDPSEKLYKIKTKSGRQVTVVDSETILVWNEEEKEFMPKKSSLLEIKKDKLPKSLYINVSDNLIKHKLYLNNYISEEEALYKNGYVYNLSNQGSNNTNLKIPDTFDMNYDNGKLFGLYVADGCVDIEANQIRICNKNTNVQAFIKTWFDKLGINGKIYKKSNQNSETYQLYSKLFAQILLKLFGHGASNKVIPEEFLYAPDEFIKGFLSGYLSCDCNFNFTSGVTSHSTSENVSTNIAFMLNRFGIHSTYFCQSKHKREIHHSDVHILRIPTKYYQKLNEVITLIDEKKLTTFEQILEKNTNDNPGKDYCYKQYKEQEDVLFDEIKEIEVIDSKNEKVYDVTVPVTLNFGLSNGLIIYDTSEVGYIQRKLIKAMEDAKIHYDLTVRDASNNIVQFLYGEDGMGSTSLESQILHHIPMELAELEKEYLISMKDDLFMGRIMEKEAYDKFKSVDNVFDKCMDHYKQVLADREYMITEVFTSEYDKKVNYPISLARLLTNTQTMYGTDKMKLPSDLNPIDVIETLDELDKLLIVTKNNLGNKLLLILLRCYLSPKRLIKQFGFGKKAFDYIINTVKQKFFNAISDPSEMVGVVSAQSIGEPTTQMSIDYESQILIKSSSEIIKCKVGEFIDDLLEQRSDNVKDLGNQSVVLNLEEPYEIMGVSDREQTSWKRISQISKHLPNGKLMKVTTRSGKSVKATCSHSFLKRSVDRIIPVEGSKLKKGDRIPVAKYISEVNNPLQSKTYKSETYVLDKVFGWIIGAYLADGDAGAVSYIGIAKIIPEFEQRVSDFCNKYSYRFSKAIHHHTIGKNNQKMYTSQLNKIHSRIFTDFIRDNFKSGALNKQIPGWVFASNKEFIAGVVSGFFDGDGSVNPTKYMIRCHSINKQLLEDLSVLLSYQNIFGCLLQQTKDRASETYKNQVGNCEVLYELNIPRKQAEMFAEKIGLYVPKKRDALQQIIEYNDRENKHSSREDIDKIPELGNIIAKIGKDLALPGQSSLYGRWKMKDSIGRNTLDKYINVFEKAYNEQLEKIDETNEYNMDNETKQQTLQTVQHNINILKQANDSDVIWDEIVNIEYYEDNNTFVYDFTVPGNDTFMVNSGLLVHNTLNTFHSAGQVSGSKVVRGVSRVKELLSFAKNIKTPAMTIYMKPEFQTDLTKCHEIMNHIKISTMQDIVKTSKIISCPKNKLHKLTETDNFFRMYEVFEDARDSDENYSPWLLIYEFDKNKMSDLQLNMIDISTELDRRLSDNKFKALPSFTDDNSDKLMMRISISFNNEKNEKKANPVDVVSELKSLNQFILDFSVKGIKGVNNAVINRKDTMKFNKDSQSFEKAFEWVIYTDGSNLMEILSLPEVDTERTTCNDVNELFTIYGIETGKKAFVREFLDTFDGDDDVGYKHVSLLADVVTSRGYLMSVDRHGINKSDIGPLAKASFEETSEMITKAGIFAEYDNIKGVSANIMLGQIPPAGTGDTTILMDMDKLTTLKTKSDLNSILEDGNAEDDEDAGDMCEIDNIGFDFKINEVKEPISMQNIQTITG